MPCKIKSIQLLIINLCYVYSGLSGLSCSDFDLKIVILISMSTIPRTDAKTLASSFLGIVDILIKMTIFKSKSLQLSPLDLL